MFEKKKEIAINSMDLLAYAVGVAGYKVVDFVENDIDSNKLDGVIVFNNESEYQQLKEKFKNDKSVGNFLKAKREIMRNLFDKKRELNK